MASKIKTMEKDGLVYWEIKDHTEMKLKVIEAYSNLWVFILSKYNTITIYDCFAGGGKYFKDSETFLDGSPLIFYKSLIDNSERLRDKTKLVLIEKNKKTFNNLKKSFENEGIIFTKENYGIKGKLIIQLINDNFNIVIEDIIKTDRNKAQLFFIDPFGYSIDFDIFRSIMSLPKVEIIFNFMYSHLIRGFASPHEKLTNQIDRLFDSSDWEKSLLMSAYEKEDYIVNLFRSRCKEISKFVFPYRICDSKSSRTYYYLYHLSNHILAAIKMKESFASKNFGKVEYISINQDQITIMDNKEIQNSEIEEILFRKYINKSISFEDLVADNIDETVYFEKHFRRVLKDLEKKGKITIQRISSKKNGLGNDDLITFKQRE
ncbi:three-Cys-motif partner protein TcmP [bacterium]|nr:three-Cys-motif partner protein TcmP [bacterium]